MAKAKKQKSMEETLWDSANKLKGSVEELFLNSCHNEFYRDNVKQAVQ